MAPNADPSQRAVLIVEDEAAVRSFARRILHAAGYHVIEASDAQHGMAVLSSEAPLDLLITDLGLPDVSGDEMVRRSRATRPDLKVLYVTGHIDQLMDTRRMWKGEAFLNKPFTAKGLQEAVSLLLDGTLKNRL